MRSVLKDYQKALQQVLNEKYNAVELQYSEPFLVVGCKGGATPMNERPFSVGTDCNMA